MSSAQDLKKIDAILNSYYGDQTPGAALMLIKDGKVFLSRTYGFANLETNVPVNPSTNFRLASVSKQFTAASILLLVNEGKFSLTNTLTDLLEGFPDYGKTITIKNLLTHTSGIQDYEDYVADTAFNPQIKDQGVLDIVMKLDSVYFPAGSEYRYSNTAYALLALLVEKYSRQKYANFLMDHIFKPLGMKNTVAFENGISSVPTRAFGYSFENGKWIRKDQSSTSAVLGDGGIYSNLEDLYLWDQSLYTTKILPKNLLEEAFSYHHLTDGEIVNYGYGWHLKQTDADLNVVYHTGSSTSFRNIFYRIPEKNFSLILLTNRNQPEEEEMLTLAEKIANEF